MAASFDLALVLFGAAFLAVGMGVYIRLAARIRQEGGKVRASEFSFPDLLLSLFLAGTFTMLVVHVALDQASAASDPAPISISSEQILPSITRYIILFVGIAGFLHFRGLRLGRVFGLGRVPWPRALAISLGLIIAAFPLVAAVGMIVKIVLHEAAQEQELVRLFRDVTRKAEYSSIVTIFAAGVIIAPVAEEFLFRGYFYAVFKRYIGGLASGLVTAGLFAAFHMNLASLPGLFVLALCFTAAYEASGTLLVPMGMHALFNSTQLLFLYWQAHAGVA